MRETARMKFLAPVLEAKRTVWVYFNRYQRRATTPSQWQSPQHFLQWRIMSHTVPAFTMKQMENQILQALCFITVSQASWVSGFRGAVVVMPDMVHTRPTPHQRILMRSEERRVGQEGRS